VDENGKKIQKVKSMRFFIVWEKWITFYGTQFFQLSSMILWNTSSTPKTVYILSNILGSNFLNFPVVFL
jgi:hypothetical protein